MSISPQLGKLIRYIDANVAGYKIDCIKELRAQATLMNGGEMFGLKEAKDTIENWVAARPTYFQLGRITTPVYEDGHIIKFI